MEGCLYFILLAIALFALAAALSAVIATIMSLYTLIAHRRWGWSDHFMLIFGVLLRVATFFLDIFSSSGRSSSHSSGSRSSGNKSGGSKSGGSFGGGSSRGGGSGRSF